MWRDGDSGWSGCHRGETGGRDVDSGSQENGDATSPRDFRFQPSLVGTEIFHSGKCELNAVPDQRELVKAARYLSPSIFKLLIFAHQKLVGRLIVMLGGSYRGDSCGSAGEWSCGSCGS